MPSILLTSFRPTVEDVSVVLVALYDACCKWTDARVSLAGRSCSGVQAVSLVPTPPVPLAPPLAACVPVVRPKRRASWLPRHPRRKAIPVPRLHSSAVVFRVYVDELWDKFIALGSDGALWHEFVALPVALQADYQALTKERLAKFSTTTLICCFVCFGSVAGLAAASGARGTADRTGCLPVVQVAARRLQHVRKESGLY